MRGVRAKNLRWPHLSSASSSTPANKKAYFSDSLNSKNKVYFSKDTLIECVNYLIDNLYYLPR